MLISAPPLHQSELSQRLETYKNDAIQPGYLVDMRSIAPGNWRQQNPFQRGESIRERLNTGKEGTLEERLSARHMAWKQDLTSLTSVDSFTGFSSLNGGNEA